MVDDEGRQLVAAGEHVAPVLMRDAFNCMHCGAYAAQRWNTLTYRRANASESTRIRRCQCYRCDGESFWLAPSDVTTNAEDPEARMLWPFGSSVAAVAHPDMPPEVREDYDEARAIVDRSPRGAAALLRLALQKLCKALGEKGDNPNDDIASLVRKGLPLGIQQALDALRVIGNNAVHPGELDLRDDQETAVSLFDLLNTIVDRQITQQKKLSAVYARLPQGARDAIAKRDARK
ncbi:MAG: hypothetical protein V7607_1228 [Solirubrobacteraceae bacterium]